MSLSKRQDFPTGLWVVATPIGNLADLASRGRQALEEASAFYCEDTRVTQQLLHALGIEHRRAAGFHRLDAHTSAASLERLALKIVEEASEGRSTVLVSDAGTPAISDPGARLVRRVRELGGAVTPVPGPSALSTFLSAAGLPLGEDAFCFRGFFPRKTSERSRELSLCAHSGVSRVFAWFESPHRIKTSLQEVARAFPDATVTTAKELSKIHEKFFSGRSVDVAHAVSDELKREGARGEWCFAIEWPEELKAEAESSDWVKALHCLLDAQVSASEAARQVSQHFGVSRKTAYERVLALSGKKI